MINKTQKKVNQYSGKFYFCSFGDSRYAASRKRIEKQAVAFDVFDSISLYNEHDLSESFRSDFKTQLIKEVCGFGYWVWKPWVILETLKKMNDNDVLLYLDMGCHLNTKGREKLLSYREEVSQNDSGFMVTQLELDDSKLERIWTKGDLLNYFQVRNQPEIIDTPQYQGGIIFIRKTNQTVTLIQSWLDIFYHDFHLIDNTPSVSENEPGFREHRHDQSVVSILLKKNGTSIIPLDEVYVRKWNSSYDKYPIQIRRDLKKNLGHTLLRKLIRLLGKPKRLMNKLLLKRSKIVSSTNKS